MQTRSVTSPSEGFIHLDGELLVLSTPLKHIDTRPFKSLVTNGWLAQADLEAGADQSLRGAADLETLLVARYNIPEDILRTCLSEYYSCPPIGYSDRMAIDLTLLKNLNVEYLKRHYWVPIKRARNSVEVLTNDPHDLDRMLDIRRAFPGLLVHFAVGLRRDITKFLGTATRPSTDLSLSDILEEVAKENPGEPDNDPTSPLHETDSGIVRLANQIIADAYRLGASDIHIEPGTGRKDTAVRYRVDGSCIPCMKIPQACRRALVSRFKIMANLDIAERRIPQDGKITFSFGEAQDIDIRVVTLPTSGFNEDVVLRILTGKQIMPLDAMDLSQRDLAELRRIAEKPYGIILCVGPTGSGKTTALHGLLTYINTQERKIWTAEDPIEISQEGLRQVQVRPKIGFTFAAAMRAFLRADPDVIMIGEMRDKETADIALEASLTGHLVLSTLHTNNSVETIARLLDMGCDAFNFADAMLGILAKRLCKRICTGCKEEYHPLEEEYDELAQAYGAEYWMRLGIPYDGQFTLFRGTGCTTCNSTGFKGRTALHELLLGTEELRTVIQSQANTGTLLKIALEKGMTTLVQDGIHKVLAGQTTYKEVQKVAIK